MARILPPPVSGACSPGKDARFCRKARVPAPVTVSTVTVAAGWRTTAPTRQGARSGPIGGCRQTVDLPASPLVDGGDARRRRADEPTGCALPSRHERMTGPGKRRLTRSQLSRGCQP
jgi:hypothetical protein